MKNPTQLTSISNQPHGWGASLSIKQCRNFDVNDKEVLLFGIEQIGIKRFRLMSYWDEIETTRGVYDFETLDGQVDLISGHNGQITMSLGARQPRWPESHWPQWTSDLPKEERNEALYKFIETVVLRYSKKESIVSWQLENEALLKNFGENGDFDLNRLKYEYKLVKSLDPSRPLIMTTSTSWGIPMRDPIPDIVGFSYYRVTHSDGKYRKSIYQPIIFKIRAFLIRLIWHRKSFIHELQAEPWGPKAIWEMPREEQDKSMSLEILKANLDAASKTNLTPIDLWGIEWWYWLNQQGDDSFWKAVKDHIASTSVK